MKRHPHETTVLGLFDNPSQAYHAINAIEAEHKIKEEDISLIANQDSYEKEEIVELVAGHRLHEESVHAGKVGGIAGAVIAGLTAITGVLSGGASLLATGPLIAIASGAGGILGALLGTGFTEEEAHKIDNDIAQGKILVVVHAENRKLAQQAKIKLNEQGAYKVHIHH